MDKTIGFIGVGAMGEPMAANLLKAGYRLRIYNRTVGKIDRLTGMGARGVKTTADAAEPGSVVVTMLANDDALMEVMLHDRSVVEKLGKGGVHLSMSTVSPATARRLAEDHVKSGVAYVSAPVFGPTPPRAPSSGSRTPVPKLPRPASSRSWTSSARAPTTSARTPAPPTS